MSTEKNANGTYNPETEEITYDGTYFYAVPVGEAVGSNSWGAGDSIDSIAKRIAKQVYNSSGHWRYVGSSDYPYIAVGITKYVNTAYFVIFVSDTNQYE